MLQRPVISFAQAQAAMKAMLDRASQTPEMPAAIAIVDAAGNLLAYANMDNVTLFARRHAIRKAYTAAVIGETTKGYYARMRQNGRVISDFVGDPNITAGEGGLVIRSKEGVIVGGVGVAGLPKVGMDEELGRIGIEAMGY